MTGDLIPWQLDIVNIACNLGKKTKKQLLSIDWIFSEYDILLQIFLLFIALRELLFITYIVKLEPLFIIHIVGWIWLWWTTVCVHVRVSI
jgi:hypothetical protein